MKKITGKRKESVMSQFRYLDGLCKKRRDGIIDEEYFIGDVEAIVRCAYECKNYWLGLED